MAFCPNCGASNPETDSVCGHCGSPLPTPATAGPSEVRTQVPAETPAASTIPATPAKKKMHPVLIVLGVLVLAVVTFILYAALSPDAPPADDPTPTTAPNSAQPTDAEATVANSSDEALRIVSQVTGTNVSELVFYMEDSMVDNGDGTLAIYVNQEKDPSVRVYLVYPKCTPEGEEYIHSFAVVNGTGDVYADPGDGSGNFTKMN